MVPVHSIKSVRATGLIVHDLGNLYLAICRFRWATFFSAVWWTGAYKALSSEATDFYGRLRDDSDVVTYGIPFSVIQRLRIDMKSKVGRN